MGRKSRQNLQEINWNVLVRTSQTFAWMQDLRSKGEIGDGSLMEFQIQQGDFRELEKGDRGMLTYQGNRYICYQKYKFKSEAQEEEKC